MTTVLTPHSASTESEPIADHHTRVLLVEDHPITRVGIRTLVNQQLSFRVCGEAASVSEALQILDSVRPQIAIVDISLPETNGIELTKQIKARAPNLPVLVVSMHDEAIYADRAIRAGAMGYIMKEEAGEKIAAALQHLLRGEIYVSAKMKQRFLHRFVNKRSDHPEFAIDTLSERERQVFRLIGSGYSTREIATELGLSTKTIDSYREHLKLKLGLDNGTDLLRHAIEWTRVEG
jgi:DNA-binding NarL/FixJ family response regulator